MLHPHTELRFIRHEIGHGVVATRPIPRGTFVWFRCRLDRVIPAAEVQAMPAAYRALLEHFASVTPEGDLLLCWDHTRYMNHGCAPTIYSAGNLEIAIRDIAAGEEITCDYGLMNSSSALDCRCGAPECRGRIVAEDVLNHGERWDALARAALREARCVEQPLLRLHEHPAAVAALWAEPERMPPHRIQYCPKERRPPLCR